VEGYFCGRLFLWKAIFMKKMILDVFNNNVRITRIFTHSEKIGDWLFLIQESENKMASYLKIESKKIKISKWSKISDDEIYIEIEK
jgi:hypothetical protein